MELSSNHHSQGEEGRNLQTGFTYGDGTTPMSYTDPDFQSPAVGGAYPASFPQYSAEPPQSAFQQDGGWPGSSALEYNSDDDGAWSQSDDISLVGPEESLLDENGTKPRTAKKRFSRDDKLRMLALRRHLDNMDGQLIEQQDGVDTTREELDKCRTSIEALTLERDHIMIQLEMCQREGNAANAYRLDSKLVKLAREIEAERVLEAQIVNRLDKAELQLTRFDLDRGKYLLEEEELQKKEALLEEEMKGNAAKRATKENRYLAQAEARRKTREKDHIAALMEHDRKHRQAMSAAKKSQEVASKYLKQTVDKLRQEEANEREREKAHTEKRMESLLNLKQDIGSNRENLRAIQARNRFEARLDRDRTDQERVDLVDGGENAAEVMLSKQRLDEKERNKQKYLADQHQKQAKLLAHILDEEKQMKKRKKLQPYLFDDPKREKTLIVKSHKRKSPTILREMGTSSSMDLQDEVGVDGDDEEDVGERKQEVIMITEKMTQDSSDEDDEGYSPLGGPGGVSMAMGTVEDPLREDLAKPEFEGLWNKQHKAYKIPKDEEQTYTLNYPSKMEKEIMAAALDKHRSGIVRKQIAAGREFKGCAFVSKPDIVHFKDFDVGKSYKKRIILTNISYSVNFLKFVDLSEHLKDFIDIQFDPPGQMSAGMSCEMLVTYKPMINEDLDGEVQFLAQTGPMTVPVRCSTKKCDFSTDVDFLDFGTQVVGETLKKTITLTNKGAKGCQFEFIKTTGLKERTIMSAGTSLGRMTTADETIKEEEEEEIEPTPKKGKKGKGKKKDDGKKAKPKPKPKAVEKPKTEAGEDGKTKEGEKDKAEDGGEEGEGDDKLLGGRLATSAVSRKSGVTIIEDKDEDEDDEFSDEEDLGPGGLDGMRVGQVSGGEIAPFSSIKLEIIFAPHTPGKVDVDIEIRFTDPDSDMIPIKGYATAIDVPVWVERQTVDLKICMFDRLYQDAIVVHNRATTALRLLFEVQKELRSHMEILPKTAYIQAQSQFSAQLKFLPRHNLVDDAAKFFDKETGVLEVPTIIRVANQTRPVPFTISSVVTSSDFEFDVDSIDFGFCTIYESVVATVKLTNTSVLSQKFGFVNLPEYIDVQPNEGFGTLLPFETIELDIIFSAKKAKDYNFELTCKSGINRDFKISCKGVGVHPPLDLSHSVIHFAATALEDNSITSFYVLNAHTNANEFTHPVPRIGKGEIAPVGPTSFEFVVPEDAPLSVSPAVGTIQPGKKTCVSIKFSPCLTDPEIREEAVRLVTRNREAQARREFEEAQLAAKRNATEAADDDDKKKKGGKKPGQRSAGKNKSGKGQGSAGLTKPKSVVSLTAEELDPKSDDYAAGKASLLRQFEGQFQSYSIPCYVASGQPGDPGTLPYDVHNTLFLEVHCPTVRPALVVISNHGRNAVDFSEVSVGQRVIKSITIQNVSEETVDLNSTILDTAGPFLMLNALRSLAPDETHTLLVVFEPMWANVFYEVLDIKTGMSTLGIVLKGHGLMPEVKTSLADDQLDMGYVIAEEEAEETFKIENTSTFAIDYRVLLDSLSYHRQLSQKEMPVFIKRDQETQKLVGPANFDGRSVFDCIPSDGTLEPGKKVEIRVVFRPDHPSDLYSDVARIQLFGKQVAHAIHLRGVAKSKIMFLRGLDEILPNVESLTILPGPEEEEVVDPKAVPPAIPTLLSFKALSSDKQVTPAARQIQVGCIRTMAVSQKKNGEFFFDNPAAIATQGFTIEPQRGMVEAGNLKPVTVTWTPPKGHDPNLPIESSIVVNLKGDVLERYNILLRALVVSE